MNMIEFPELTNLDIAFPASLIEEDKFMEEARKNGFENHNNPWCRYFESLFFQGGKLIRKKGLSDDDFKKRLRYYKHWAGSFDPKHEHKEMVCAFILSQCVELPKEYKKTKRWRNG